jgi:hypothetical protein
MSPHQASFLIPMLMLCIYVTSFYFCIRAAKRRVLVWKRYSTFAFLRSMGMAGIKRRAKLVWMNELGYDEGEGIILAEYQTRVSLLTFAGFFLFGSSAVSFVQR